jgi:hypothetical protein
VSEMTLKKVWDVGLHRWIDDFGSTRRIGGNNTKNVLMPRRNKKRNLATQEIPLHRACGQSVARVFISRSFNFDLAISSKAITNSNSYLGIVPCLRHFSSPEGSACR